MKRLRGLHFKGVRDFKGLSNEVIDSKTCSMSKKSLNEIGLTDSLLLLNRYRKSVNLPKKEIGHGEFAHLELLGVGTALRLTRMSWR